MPIHLTPCHETSRQCTSLPQHTAPAPLCHRTTQRQHLCPDRTLHQAWLYRPKRCDLKGLDELVGILEIAFGDPDKETTTERKLVEIYALQTYRNPCTQKVENVNEQLPICYLRTQTIKMINNSLRSDKYSQRYTIKTESQYEQYREKYQNLVQERDKNRCNGTGIDKMTKRTSVMKSGTTKDSIFTVVVSMVRVSLVTD